MENPMKYNIGARAHDKFILKYVKPKTNGEKILDVGCGLGYVTTSLLAKKGIAYGVDLDENALKFANKYGDASFLTANALTLPFKDSSFDYIVTLAVIEHVPDARLFLKEIKRVLKKNGEIVLATPSAEALLGETHTCHERGLEYDYKDSFSRKELFQLFDSAGLKILKTEYSLFFFTKILMYILKFVYKAKCPSFEKQSDVLDSSNSIIFKIYKKLFPILMISNYMDLSLSKLMKDNRLMITAIIVIAKPE